MAKYRRDVPEDEEGELTPILTEAWYVRPGTSDRTHVEDVYFGSEYSHLWARLDSSDVVLDLGANIGAFVCRAAQIAARVIAVEPSPGNVAMMRRNVEYRALGNVTILEGAVVPLPVDHVTLQLFTNGSKASHSLVQRRSPNPSVLTRVPAFDINALLRDYQPTAIKMDIEGVELEVLEAIESWDGVRQIAIEVHPGILHLHPDDMLQRTASLVPFSNHAGARLEGNAMSGFGKRVWFGE